MPTFPPVPRRRFGRTELSMPVFSTGGMRYQQDWKDLPEAEISAESTAHVASCIRESIKHGIDHIETARGYGSSERQLGDVFPEFPRDSLIIQTKIGIRDTEAEFIESFETSMSRLRLKHVDLLAIHGINTPEELQRAIDYGVPRMREWKRQGRIRWIGFSTHGPTDVLVQAVHTGLFDYVNVHWYFVNHDNWPVICAARHQDMGVFLISPNDKGGRLWEPPQKLRDFCRPLTPMQFNDLYCLSREEVHTLSLGASKPSDYAEHAAAMRWYDDRAAISETIARRIRAEIDAHFVPGWHKTYAAGVPRTDMCPGGINVREILRLYSYAKAMDMVEFAKSRYNLFSNGGPWFPGNSPENFDEAAMAATLAGSPHRDRILRYLREADAMLRGEAVQRQSVAAKDEEEGDPA
jgi:uncharacterized protein